MTKVLVLSSSQEPLNICDWRRALSLITAGKATVLESYEAKAHGSDQRAAVIMLKRPHPLAGLYAGLDKRQPPRLAPSRRNILHRDGYACRYCKAHGPAVTLTLDHVTPRCQGGKNSWENLVTACSRCNNKKGGRNLEESGMSLTPVPHYPTNVAAFRASMFRKLGMSHPSWEKYLPWTTWTPKEKTMSCKCSPNCAVTGSVLVTVNAASVADAEALAKSLPNFTYDDPPGAFDIGGGQYMFSGHASAPLSHGSIVSVCPNGQAHAIGTGTTV